MGLLEYSAKAVKPLPLTDPLLQQTKGWDSMAVVTLGTFVKNYITIMRYYCYIPNKNGLKFKIIEMQ